MHIEQSAVQSKAGKPGKRQLVSAGEWQAAQCDWPAIRTAYTDGILLNGQRIYPTVSELGRSYGVLATVIKQRVANEDWSTLRRQRQEALQLAINEAKPKELATQNAQADTLAIDSGIRTLKIVQKEMMAIELEHAGSQGDKVKKGTRKGLGMRLAMLMKAAESGQRMVKLALGEPTDHQKLSGPAAVALFAVDAAKAILEAKRVYEIGRQALQAATGGAGSGQVLEAQTQDVVVSG